MNNTNNTVMTTIRRLFTALALLLAAGVAAAQSCNPTAPQVDPGTGFAAFGAREQLLARGGNAGPAWEWALGTDTDADGQNVKASLDWVSGKSYGWTLTYTGAGSATVAVRDQGTLLFTRTYATGMDAGNALQLQVGTNPSIGAGTTISATVTSLNGLAVTGSLAQTGNNQDSAQNLYFFYPAMASGFTAQGTVTLTYASLPSGSRVQFNVRAGNIACTGGGNTPPTVSLTSPVNGAVFTAPAAVTLTANAADSDGTVAQVEFFQGATLLATVTNAPYAYTLNNVAAGNYSYTARATDNQGAATTSAAASVIVNAPPTVTLTSPANGASFNAPASITLTANAQDSDGTVAQVEFYQGAALISTVTTAPYTYTLTNVAAGTYSLTARATDNRGAVTTSAAVSINVNAGPTVALTSPVNGAVYAAPAAITLTASANDPDGTVAQVAFYQGTTLLATLTGAPYSVTLSNLGSGSYTFTAQATDNLGVTTTSAAVTVTVNALPVIALTSPAHGANFNAPATITVTAVATDSDGTIAQVELLQGATVIATLTSPPYTTTLSNVPAGSYTYSARATDHLGGVTTSAAVTITVTRLAEVYFIHTDHLNTPRVITNQVGQAVWRWDNNDPYGANVPDENPSGLGNFTCNLRLPGQYFDRETNLHYNYFRDYWPDGGRYIQSDPIGLKGGINTFAYVGNNPLTKFDPFGLDETVWMPGRGRSIADGPRNGNWCGGNWSGGQVPSLNRGQDGPRGSADSLDRCCMVHDRCYSQCDRYPEKNIREACLIKCDQALVSCLRNLNDDCTRWPEPPRAGTESDSQFYRDDALRHFDERIRRWDANNRSR